MIEKKYQSTNFILSVWKLNSLPEQPFKDKANVSRNIYAVVYCEYLMLWNY